MGAVDPTSGTVSLHEVVRGFGGLIRSGWKPARTIVFASWDAEEVFIEHLFLFYIIYWRYPSMVSSEAQSGEKILRIGYQNMSLPI